MDKYLEDMLARHRAKVLEAAEMDGPAEEDDATNPHITFWAMMRTGAELDEQFAKNTAYYASGRCGGCETCGEPPFPRVTYNAGEQFVTHLRQVLADMEVHDAKVRTEHEEWTATTDDAAPAW